MRSHFLNPSYHAHEQLGFTEAEWDALKAKVQTLLDENANAPTLAIEDARAVDAALADDKAWAQIAGDMGLFTVPGPEA